MDRFCWGVCHKSRSRSIRLGLDEIFCQKSHSQLPNQFRKNARQLCVGLVLSSFEKPPPPIDTTSIWRKFSAAAILDTMRRIQPKLFLTGKNLVQTMRSYSLVMSFVSLVNFTSILAIFLEFLCNFLEKIILFTFVETWKLMMTSALVVDRRRHSKDKIKNSNEIFAPLNLKMPCTFKDLQK